jgi:hypothetical protein
MVAHPGRNSHTDKSERTNAKIQGLIELLTGKFA